MSVWIWGVLSLVSIGLMISSFSGILPTQVNTEHWTQSSPFCCQSLPLWHGAERAQRWLCLTDIPCLPYRQNACKEGFLKEISVIWMNTSSLLLPGKSPGQLLFRGSWKGLLPLFGQLFLFTELLSKQEAVTHACLFSPKLDSRWGTLLFLSNYPGIPADFECRTLRRIITTWKRSKLPNSLVVTKCSTRHFGCLHEKICILYS